MADPDSVAKWLQIRNNCLKLLSLGENPGIEKYLVNFNIETFNYHLCQAKF